MTAMASTTPALAPPSYDTLPPRPSSSPPFIPQEPPSYSNQPSPDEETVAYTPRGPAGAPHPQGTFVRKWPQATLILTDQEEGTRLPTYGRGGKIMGELGLASAERVVRVSVKFFGQMTLSVADSGSSTVTLVSDTRVLWKDNPGDPTSSSTSRCPSLFPIDFEFPHTYTLGDNHWRMPPSFEVSFLGIPAFFVRCLFTLSVTITRARKLKGVAWTTSKTYITLVNHRPRIRPHRPIVMLDSVFASIKPVPEEWMQVVGKMGVRPKSGMRPIECHLFVPSVQTYALSDTIPFHLQIISSRRSLRELLPPSSALLRTHFRRPSSSCSSSSPSHHAPSRPSSESDRDAYWEHDHESNTYVGTGSFAIRVTIARQVVVEINERRRFRTFTLGLGRMWSVPPGWGVCSSAGWAEEKCGKGGWGSLKEWARVKDAGGKEGKEAEEEAEDADVCLDWQGEVKCWPEVTAGGFTASNLFVKDFLVLALTPPNARSSFLMPMQVSHPIRLVTDSWVDGDALHPHDV